jgi:hypothetical protein
VPWGQAGPEVRVGDSEREQVVEELRRHFAAGRLEIAEYEDRTSAALKARTRGELEPLLTDLPGVRAASQSGPPVRDAKPPAALRAYFYGFWLPLNALLLLIWILTGADYYFWPIWPMLGTGVPFIFMLSSRAAQR